jgi:hypothetical protein
MHSMHNRARKPGGRKYVVNLIGYQCNFLEDGVFWEQEVGGSNPLAPTKKSSA